jgi:hypothetical protein
MKPIYKLGRFKRPQGTAVNVWKMKRGAWDVYAYRPQGKPPVVIPLAELGTWTKISD